MGKEESERGRVGDREGRKRGDRGRVGEIAMMERGRTVFHTPALHNTFVASLFTLQTVKGKIINLTKYRTKVRVRVSCANTVFIDQSPPPTHSYRLVSKPSRSLHASAIVSSSADALCCVNMCR